jgi:hypothetical protein
MSPIAGAYDHRNMIGIDYRCPKGGNRYRNGRPRYVRPSLDSDQVADIAGGPVRANSRHQRVGRSFFHLLRQSNLALQSIMQVAERLLCDVHVNTDWFTIIGQRIA